MSAPRPVTALTGGSGFLGSHIADALLAAGHQVRVAVRRTSDLRWLADKPLETVVVDVSDAAACAEFLAGTTNLVHCAGVVSGPDEASYQLGNVRPTVNLLQAAERVWGTDSQPTFLLVSSLAASGPASLARPATEDDPLPPGDRLWAQQARRGKVRPGSRRFVPAPRLAPAIPLRPT